MEITIENLVADGWVRTLDPTTPIEKVIENINPLNASEDTDLKMVVHHMYNSETFAIVLPDGGLLNFAVRSMEELKAFETSISFYDAPF